MKKTTQVTIAVAGAAAFTATTQVDASADTYTVKAGDTVSQIAVDFGTTVEAIVNNNQLADADLIFVDQKLDLGADVPVDQSQPVATSNQTATANTVPAAATALTQATGSGSVYDQFIAAGGTPAMWVYIVMPESGGNPDAISPNGYHGLGQTKQAWGYGSVATQTAGMLNYANARYGSIDNAIAFRNANGWW
jgi:LysM repeat protein